jgi:hypothetical protein
MLIEVRNGRFLMLIEVRNLRKFCCGDQNRQQRSRNPTHPVGFIHLRREAKIFGQAA